MTLKRVIQKSICYGPLNEAEQRLYDSLQAHFMTKFNETMKDLLTKYSQEDAAKAAQVINLYLRNVEGSES